METVRFQSSSPSSLVSALAPFIPDYRLVLTGANQVQVRADRLWLVSPLVRSILDSLGQVNVLDQENVLLMPDYEGDVIRTSLEMLEMADPDEMLVFDGRNRSVLEALGVCIQKWELFEEFSEDVERLLEEWSEADSVNGISESVNKQNTEDHPDSDTDSEDNIKKIQSYLIMDQPLSDSDEEDNDNEIIEPVQETDPSKRDFPTEFSKKFAHKSSAKHHAKTHLEASEINLPSVGSKLSEPRSKHQNQIKENYPRIKSTLELIPEKTNKEIDKQIDQLISKEDKVWRCKKCNKAGSRHQISSHAEVHVEGYQHPCPACPLVSKTRTSLKVHYRNKHCK